MSEHHYFIFPKYPHLSPPNWRELERRLLEEEIILPSVGSQVLGTALRDLSLCLAQLPGSHYIYDPMARTTGDVIASYIAAGCLPPDVPIRHDQSVSEAVAMLRKHGVDLEDGWRLYLDASDSTWCSDQYRPGPGYARILGDDSLEMQRESMSLVLLEFDSGGPFVSVGEGMCAPSIPGSELELEELPPYGNYVDFIGAAYEDLETQWVSPDGRSYYIMDLDWHWCLGIGHRMIRLSDFDYRDLEELTERIAELTGQPMSCCHRWL
ncbi:hypothetical protein [[Pseudomonas] boreopolis]|uniref:Uncharacterized protein n=1 Tax=Xanthomonas boreopolis TaxID=86183 RepID=A0A919FBJ9_9XANT|nr:hypothetical protein GCM10009090_33130 [[Pseudomonas] boreopolis]